jgi:hypothetical protein
MSGKFFQIVGKTRIYHTDGTGRDTYVGFDNGGNTKMYEASKGCLTQNGKFNATTNGQFGYPKQRSAAVKSVHYHADGTGRDTYIHCDQGGYMSNYAWQKQENAYVSGLRGYGTTINGTQNSLAAQSKGRNGLSPMKDFFVEGQVSIRHPQWRHAMSKTHKTQRSSVERLAIPRKSAEHFIDQVNGTSMPAHCSPLQKGDFLRSSRELNFTPFSQQNAFSPQPKRASTKNLAQA